MGLSIAAPYSYLEKMEVNTVHHRRYLAPAAVGVALAVLSLAAFFGWIVQGPDMFLTLAQSGLSWCL